MISIFEATRKSERFEIKQERRLNCSCATGAAAGASRNGVSSKAIYNFTMVDGEPTEGIYYCSFVSVCCWRVRICVDLFSMPVAGALLWFLGSG